MTVLVVLLLAALGVGGLTIAVLVALAARDAQAARDAEARKSRWHY